MVSCFSKLIKQLNEAIHVNSCTYIGINTFTVGLVFIHYCADGNNEWNKTVPHTDKVVIRIPNFKDLAAEDFSIKIRDQSNKYTGSHNFQARSRNCEKRRLDSSCLSVCLSTRNSSPPTRHIFMKCDISEFFEKLSRKNQVSLKSDKNNGHFTWRPMYRSIYMYTYMYRGADKSLAGPRRKRARKHVRDTRDFNNIETRAVIKLFFLQGKAPKEMQAILTETLACFHPGRAKD